MNNENECKNMSKNEYYRNWLMNNQERIKQVRKNWYESHKDTEDYKQKRKDYNKQYYLKKKTENKSEDEPKML
jgi:hypothetical protein